MTSKYILYDQKRGLFLGILAGYAIFSEQDYYETTRLPSFETLEIATKFTKEFLPTIVDKVEYLEVFSNDDSDYVNIVDIIKSGHKDKTDGIFKRMHVEPTLH